MKKYNFILSVMSLIFLFNACSDNNFQDDIYINPVAKFTIGDGDESRIYDVYETVKFENKGQGQNYVVYPGDVVDNNGKPLSHVYGENGAQGFSTASNGKFSYSYSDPGTYNVVWIASSINAKGEIVMSIDSAKVTVKANNGGLLSFGISRLVKMSEYGSDVFYSTTGEFITEHNINCAIPYRAYTSAIKRPLTIFFELESDFAKLHWFDGTKDNQLVSNSTNKVFNFYNGTNLVPQKLTVKTASNTVVDYEVAAVLIPEFTSFEINGVNATITRDVSAYNKFRAEVTLPSGTGKNALTPIFEVMKNDPTIIYGDNRAEVKVNGQLQTSGNSVVDFSAPVTYEIKYTVKSAAGLQYTQSAYYEITVK